MRGAGTSDTAAAWARVLDLLAPVGLLEKADEYPGRLSGGQGQRDARSLWSTSSGTIPPH